MWGSRQGWQARAWHEYMVPKGNNMLATMWAGALSNGGLKIKKLIHKVHHVESPNTEPTRPVMDKCLYNRLPS